MLNKALALGLLLSFYSAVAVGNKSVSGAMVSKTLAGTGVAHFGDEFDAILENPAMMTYTTTDVGTHKAAVEVNAHYINMQTAPLPEGTTYQQSKGKAYYLPFFGYFYNATDRVKFGTGLYQIAGASSDFSDSKGLQNAKNSFGFFAVPFSASYQLNESSSFGISMNAISSMLSLETPTSTKDQTKYTVSPAVGYVHNFGDGNLVGAHYLRGVDVTFAKMADLDNDGNFDDMRMGNPDEYSVGYGRKVGNLSYTGEYKYVTWGSAANFKDLGWKNQNIFAAAVQARYSEYTLRGGYTYATQTVPVQTDVNGDTLVSYQGKQVPTYVVQAANAQSGICQTAVSLGLGYTATPAWTFNTGVLYYPEKQVDQTGTSTALGGAYKTSGKLQQTELVIMASYQVNPNFSG